MKDAHMKKCVELAKVEAGPISTIAKNSTEQGIVLVTKLEPALKEAGYDVQYEDKTNGSWCRIYLPGKDTKEPTLEAQGYSMCREDALLQAVFGTVRQEEAKKAVGEHLEKHEIEVDPQLRQTIEDIHILQGAPQAKVHIQAMADFRKSQK